MPIRVNWYEKEKRNIWYRISEIQGWSDLPLTFQEVLKLLDSVDYQVNLIIDMTETERLPALQLSEMKQIANAPAMSHPNTTELLAVGMNRYMRMMFRVFKQIFPHAASRYKLFSSMENLNNYLNSPAIK